MTTTPTPAALLSVHDVMPETLPAVRRLLALLPPPDRAPVTLLVVPGRGWDAAGIAELAAWQRAGYRLAGHGWQHHCPRIRRPWHRLHSLLLSRRVAEHLDLDADGILGLLRACGQWFAEHHLAAPALYVPPAWALGAVSRARLAADCPFPLIEVFGGVLSVRSGRLHRVPLLGYEADSPLRAPVLRVWNALNRAAARRAGVLRIGIHPRDADLHLGADLRADLARYPRLIDYPALATVAPAG